MRQELRVPPVGESIASGQIASWLRQEGERVAKGESLFELETEKASMSVPSPADGFLRILVQAGAEVAIDQLVAYIDESADGVSPQAAPAAAPMPAPEPPPMTTPEPRKTAQNAAPKPSTTPATTPAPAPAPAAAPPLPAAAPPMRAAPLPPAPPSPTSDARVTRSPLSMIRRTIARRLVQARQEAAHLTTFNEIDMSEVIRLRKAEGEDFSERFGVKLGFMSFFVKASVRALQEYPVVNGRIEGDELVSPGFYDIGVAVSTDRGLLVPIIRDADSLSFAQIETRLAELAAKARDKTIALSELQGGSFTITNGGIYGSMLSTPIPNYPQSAILGMHSIQRRPVAVGDEVKIRPMMYVALTYDHRLIDGREAVLFLVKIKEFVENPERLIFGL